jgi:hypothetical protein
LTLRINSHKFAHIEFWGIFQGFFMKFFTTAFLIVSISAAVAFASTKPTKVNQTFPATEEGPSDEVVSSAPGYIGSQAPAPAEPESSDAAAAAQAPAPTPPKTKWKSHVTVKTTLAPAPAVVAPQTAPVVLTKGFDLVPNNQTEPLIRRLKLSEQLVVKYGRAYDYRAMTVLELQSILDKLDADAQRQTQARVDERMQSRAVIGAQATIPNESPAALQETHDSIGSEAPEAPVPPAQIN